MLGDALGNADDQGEFGGYGFFNTSGRKWRSVRPVSFVIWDVIRHFGRSYGTNIAEAVAPVSLMASLTLAKMGFPRCVWPAFLGFVPPTTLVPAPRQYSVQCFFCHAEC